MKVLLLNGSPHAHGCTDAALREVAGALAENGVETELFWIGTKPIPGCIACNRCAQTGRCAFDDAVNEIGARLRSPEFAGLVVGSPVYYAGASGQVQSFLDRLFYSSGNAFAGKVGAAVVSCRRGGASTAFERLNAYFTISNMYVVGSQYWNQVHGFTPEDVKKDLEGLQTMRTLGRNMAYLLKALAAAQAAGVPLPKQETPVMTNFIR